MGWTVGDGVSDEERHIGSKDVEECVRECYKLGVSEEKIFPLIYASKLAHESRASTKFFCLFEGKKNKNRLCFKDLRH